MKYGKIREQAIQRYEDALERGDKSVTIAPHFLHPPELGVHLQFYYTAYGDLSYDRDGNTSLIPWTSINFYAMRYGLVGMDFEVFVLMIRKLDGWYYGRLEKLRKDNESNSRRSGR